jgi:hypothetical protein
MPRLRTGGNPMNSDQLLDLHSELDDDCLWCVDGHVPAGIDPVLGPVFADCAICVELCTTCYGIGRTVALVGYFEMLCEALWHLGLEVNLCRECLGVTSITWRSQP